MGTHNHRLQIGNRVYLEIVALDPAGTVPGRPRWFELDEQDKVRADWDKGNRLRGWVVSTENIDATLSAHGMIFGSKVPLPAQKASFAFGVPNDGSLPLDGIAPSIIDHYSDTSHFAAIPDMGARLRSFTIEHLDPTRVVALYRNLAIDHPPTVIQGQEIKYRAFIDTRTGSRELS